jgi:hypothetical protein
VLCLCERENQRGAQSRKVGCAAGRRGAAHVRAGKTEGCTDYKIGERPLYANQYLRAPFAFFPGRAFKFAKCSQNRRAALQIINIYVVPSFPGRAFRFANCCGARGVGVLSCVTDVHSLVADSCCGCCVRSVCVPICKVSDRKCALSLFGDAVYALYVPFQSDHKVMAHNICVFV